MAARFVVPRGTVVGVAKDDVVVRWDVGIEAALGPASLAGRRRGRRADVTAGGSTARATAPPKRLLG